MGDGLEPIEMIPEEARPEKPAIDETSGLPMLSRRSLLGGLAATTLAASGMMLLPKARGGVLFAGFNPLGAEKAYASSIWTGSFSFTVVGSDEVGIQVVDVSGLTDYDDESEKKAPPVKNATVTLASLSNDSVVSGQTDDEGKVILSIRDIAPTTDPEDGVFRANAVLSVTTEKARVKMRDFSTGRVCLEGATGLVVGAHKTDDTDVYMERCTFDDWDIHYSKLTFLRSNENTLGDHTFAVRVKGTTDNVKVSLVILDAATKSKTVVKEKTTTAKLNSKSGLVEGKIQGHFLQTGHADCISVDDAIARITLTVGGKSYTTDIELLVEDTPVDSEKVSGPIIPFTSRADTLFNFTASGDWPCFNKLSFSALGPFPAVQVSATPYGGIIGFGTDFNMMDDKGHFSKDSWKKDHKGNIAQRYKNMQDRKVQQYNDRKNAGKEVEMYDLGNPNPQAATRKSPFLKNCEVNIIARLALMYKYAGFEGQGDKRKTKFEGGGTVELGLSANGTLTLEFMAGPVPMYLSGTLGASLLAGFTVVSHYRQLANTKELDCTDMAWSVDDSLAILVKFLLNISLGVGYKGLVSLSFDATFTFPFYFGFLEKGGGDKTDPHITIGVTILLEIVLQAGLFKLSGQIYSYDKSTWYNNWGNDSAALTGEDAWGGIEPRFRLTHPGESTPRHTLVFGDDGRLLNTSADPFTLMAPTTDAMMEGSHEADARAAGGNGAGALTGEEFAALEERHIASFKPALNQTGVFKREANAVDGAPDEATTVFVGQMPKAVVRENGDVETELVPCEGANAFFFGERPDVAVASGPAVSGVAAGGASSGSGTLVAGTIAALPGESFEGDPLLGFALGATREFDYTPVAGKTTGTSCDPVGVAGIAAHDGVVPNVNAVIYKNVHSDPRQRVVTIGGVPHLFRVMTVKYPTANNGCYCRSRVVASKYDSGSRTWGEPKVLEYNTGNRDLPRVDIYDYEFDIAVRTGDKKWTQEGEACLIVTGGLRPSGDGTTFHEAVSNSTVAVLVIDKDLEVLQCIVRGVKDSSASGLAFGDDAAESMICSPCIVDGFAPNGASGSLAFAFLRRSAGSAAGLTTSAAKVTFCVGHCYVRDGYLSFPSVFKEAEGVALASDVYGMKAVAGNAVKGKYDSLLTLVINHQQGYDVCTATIPPGQDFSKLQITHCIQSSDKLPEIQPWPHHGTFLFVKERPAVEDAPDPDFHLYQGTFEVGKTGQTAFGAQQVDLAGLKGASFCVSPSGEFVFYYESYRDKPDSNPEADVTSSNVTGTGDDTVRHIMASRLIDGKFCEDFPFCEIDQPIDHIEVLNLEGDASSFIATEITDADNSLADMRYIGVPNVLAAEIESFVQTDPFVCAGHPCPFQMDVRNHGNLIIGGFDVQMLDPEQGGTVVDTAHVGEIEPDKISPTAANMGWGHTSTDTPQLTAEEKQGFLMPGKKMSYGVSFNIPEDWEGKKTVLLRISNAWTPGMRVAGLAGPGAAGAAGFTEERGGLVVRAVNEGVHFFHQGAEGGVSLVDSRQGEGSVYDPAETVSGGKPDPDKPVKPDPDDPVKPDPKPGEPDPKPGEPDSGNPGYPGSGNPVSSGSETGSSDSDNPSASKSDAAEVTSDANPLAGDAGGSEPSAKKDDDLWLAGPLALALAGAGALAAGYSARRTRIEREAREDDGE